MAKYNSLLFRGTLHKNASTKGQLGWISISGLNKYKGHKGYLEITGKGNSFVEIEQVRTGNVALPVPMNSIRSGPFWPKEPDLKILSDPIWTRSSPSFPPVSYPAGFLRSKPISSIGWSKKANRLGGRNLSDCGISQKGPIDRKRSSARRYATTMGRGTDYEGYNRSGQSPQARGQGKGQPDGSRLARRRQACLGEKLGGQRQPSCLQGHGQPHMALHVWSWNRADHGRLRTNGSDAFQPAASRLARADFMENDWSVSADPGDCPFLHLSSVEQGNPANSSAKSMNLIRTTQVFTGCRQEDYFEAIRDSLLAHSGRLDRKMFGPSVAVHRTAFMTGRGAGAAVRRTVREDGASTDRFTVISFLLSCSLLTNPPPSEPKAEGPFPTCRPVSGFAERSLRGQPMQPMGQENSSAQCHR